MTEIVMPRLSDTMEEGTVLRWLKRDGEHVSRGEELVEIETDKAAMVYESDQEGFLQILAREGDTLAVGAPIAHVGEAAAGAEVTGTADVTGGAPVAAAETQSDGQTRPTPAPVGVSAELSPPTAPPKTGDTARDGERVKASPLARRIARERGVDLHALAGSGPGGRIVKADVQGGAPAGTAAPGGQAGESVSRAGDAPATEPGGAPTAPAMESSGTPGVPAMESSSTPVMESSGAPTAPPTLAERVAAAKGETTVVELTRTQQTVARRMAESKATIPDFALQAELDMERCVALRTELKRLSPEEAPTYNDMVVKACALALHEHPRANGSYRDGRLQLHSRVNVGVAVAVDSDGPLGGALVVPTVFDADLKSLGEIARETRALAERVRTGTITPPELGGGTFTVSNLGMYGVRSFTAIVNPPQAGILSVGSLAPRAVVRAGGADGGGEVVARHTMAVTLACDHRILYGADAARFLARVRELLEEPAALTL